MRNLFCFSCKGAGFVETHAASGVYMFCMFCPTSVKEEAEQFRATTAAERALSEDPHMYVNDVERLREEGWNPESATPAHHEEAWDFNICLTWMDVIMLSGLLLAIVMVVGLAVAKVLAQVCT